MDGYASGWNKPEDLLRIRKLKTKKRALQDRLFDESPSKKAKRQQKAKKLFRAQPPPPDDVTCEDSTLMEIIGMKQPVMNFSTPFNNSAGERTPSSCLSASLSPSPTSSLSMSPHRHSLGHSSNSQGRLLTNSINHCSIGSPMKSYLPSLSSFSGLSTPPSDTKKRQRITPAPAVTSPVWASNSHSITKRSARRGLDLSLVEEETSNVKWRDELCIDWSVKTRLLIKSESQFGWSNALKTSEESSGISAFVRCIDMEPNQNSGRTNSSAGSQLDTSLGAQFHQCCLYWQHPYLPTVKLFPRDVSHSGVAPVSLSAPTYAGNIKLEERALDAMFLEWVDSFRSAFQLLRTRQCPYFYLFGNQFTCLFSAAGTQGLECLQIYVTPSTRGFREALKKEGIEFTLPYHEPYTEAPENKVDQKTPSSKEVDSDDEPDKWLNEIGVSQDLSLSMSLKSSPPNHADEKGKSTLLMITGDSSLAFFNFLINAKNFLVSYTGSQSGLPPTIIGPVAFQSASLRSLTVKHSRVKKVSSDRAYTLEILGPILPHTIHMLCNLLNKTVKNYEMVIDTMTSTIPINVNRQITSPNSKQSKPNAFDVQNLSDCGTKRSFLEVLCRGDIIDTLKSRLECHDLKYSWN